MKRRVIYIGLVLSMCLGLTGCGVSKDTYEGVVVQDENQMTTNDSEPLYELAQYVQDNYANRSCMKSKKIDACQSWIAEKLTDAGYEEGAITFQELNGPMNKKMRNIICHKEGKSDKRIIVGAHYDGDGISDNGSGMVLLLYEACKLVDEELPYSIDFVFFTGEEVGLYGSNFYANNLTEEDLEQIIYMINMDSLGAGDFCYLYGGMEDKETQTVKDTQIVEKALELSEELGLSMRTNPWNYDNFPPGQSSLQACSPMTLEGCSDYWGCANRGIPYVYFEATNWETGSFDGYDDTAACGGIMNTPNDNLTFLEKHFPGRYKDHLTRYEILLYEMLTNDIMEGEE